MPKPKKQQVPIQTTAQSLSGLIKSCRDIMRKDKGLNGDLDRLPMLTWIMFLKFLDDLEQVRETEAKIAGKRFTPAIESPYRWRDWAAKPDGITGDALIAFINNEEAMRPNATKGPGLFAYLRSLRGANGGDRRDVIRTVFQGVVNRMINGYLLRDVLNKVNGIHFTSSNEIHTLAYLYESILREMRDAAGDSGEFYTPRAVVKFIVAAMNPQLGETILDPAAGTGGFLVEAFEHLKKQCKTTGDHRQLQQETLHGCEAKPLPYLLCQMNLLLHGLEYPRIDPGNALRFPLREIRDKDRVDVLITNPPFGGEEERGILGNFPGDKQTNETALLFLQLIMRKLRQQSKPGRAAVVIPDGILSQEGIAVRIRAMLVDEYRLHTVVRLPRGVFEPYTKSSTSILFFDAQSPEDYVWYYEVPIRSGIKAYTQHRPFMYEECTDILSWWNNRRENARAWKVSKNDIKSHEYSLNFRNPSSPDNKRFPSPARVATTLVQMLKEFGRAVSDHSEIWSQLENNNGEVCKRIPLGELVRQVKREEILKPDTKYAVFAMSWYAKGLYVKHQKFGRDIKATKLYRVEPGDFVYCRLFAWKGSFAEAGTDQAGCYVSNEFPTFQIVDDRIRPGFLWAYFSQPTLWDYIESLSTGTTSTSRLRLKESRLLSFPIPLPSRQIQDGLAKLLKDSLKYEKELKGLADTQGLFLPAILERILPLGSE